MRITISGNYHIEQAVSQADVVAQAIAAGRLHAGNISASSIRALGKADHNLKDRLAYGQKTLCGQAELAQYLWTYAPMVQAQWQAFAGRCRFTPQGPFQLADYGCGQGLGMANVLDSFSPAQRQCISGVTLVEPSTDALARARALVQAYLPGRPCAAIRQHIEHVPGSCLPSSAHGRYLHLFSNVLDLQRFNPRPLLAQLLRTRGKHTFWAVSHNRDFDGGAPLLRQLADDLAHAVAGLHDVTLHGNLLETFDVCMRTRTSSTIAWQACVEVA